MRTEILSIKQPMDEWSRREDLLLKTIECFASSVEEVERNLFSLYPLKLDEPAPTFKESLRRIRQHPSPPDIEEVRGHLAAELASARRKLETKLAGTIELSEILDLLKMTVQHVRDGGSRTESDLLHVAAALSETERVESVDQFRTRVRAQIHRLTSLVQSMREENSQILGELEAQMSEYRRKLDDAQRLASIDSGTGLASPAEFEARARQYVGAGVAVSLLLLEVNRLSSLAGHFGRLAADALLLQVSKRLRDLLGSDEIGARMAGNVFVILLPVKMEAARVRALQIESAVATDYRLDGEFGGARVPVSFLSGLAESRHGEEWVQLFARAEHLLHHPSRPA